MNVYSELYDFLNFCCTVWCLKKVITEYADTSLHSFKSVP
jgi:hypothetical protein